MAAAAAAATEPPALTSNQEDSSNPAKTRMFVPTLTSIPPAMSALLSNYSSIPPAEQINHIISVRDTAYQSHPYPCLGRFRFVNLDLSNHPLYRSGVLPLLLRAPSDTSSSSSSSSSHTPVFLDLGTCLGQDVRKLIYDGVAPERVYGSDIVPGFIDAGYALFRDEHKLPRDRHFLVPGGVFDDNDNDGGNGSALRKLDGSVDVLNATAVFHLFDLPDQIRVAHRVLRLLRKDPGHKVLVVGGQAGKAEAGVSVRENGRRLFRHNVESWRRMWEEEVFASAEWQEKIASYRVEGELQDARRYTSQQDRQLGDGGGKTDDKGMNDFFKDVRWHVFWIWVEFR